jgi:hypothetical protein
MPTETDFREQLSCLFQLAESKRERSVAVSGRDLHHVIGGYPGRAQRNAGLLQGNAR